VIVDPPESSAVNATAADVCPAVAPVITGAPGADALQTLVITRLVPSLDTATNVPPP
jgi:hypothetical protein